MKRFELDAAFLDGKCGRNVLRSPYFRGKPQPVTPVLREAEKSPQVQPVANPITGSKEVDLLMTDDIRLIRLRFFRDISEERRRRILVELGAIPVDLTDRLDHTIEQRFFAKLVAQGRAAELSTAIDEAIVEQKQGEN